MEHSGFGRRAVAAAVLAAALGAVSAEGSAAEAEASRSGWYLAAGAGANWTATTALTGSNRDTICYPVHNCSHLPGGAPTGYRWLYDLHTSTGAAFEIAVGRAFGNTRVELSAARRTNPLRHEFKDITYHGGAKIVPAADSDYSFAARESLDDLTTNTLSLNLYQDFPLPETGLVPYIGAGIGLSAIRVGGLFYHAEYSCKDGRSCAGLGQYDSKADTDLSGTAVSGHLHAGLGYRLSERLTFDLKLSFSAMNDFEDTARYTVHPVSGLTSTAEIDGIRQWSATIGLRYSFGAP